MISNSKDLDDKLQPIRNMFKYSAELGVLFNRQTIDLLNKGLNVIKEDLLSVAVNEKKPGFINVDLIVRCIEIFTEVLVTQPTTEFFKELADKYTEVINNWNLQVAKNDRVTRKLGFLGRLLRNRKTMDDTTEILRILNYKLQNERNYRPPAYELSRHYLKELQTKITKE